MLGTRFALAPPRTAAEHMLGRTPPGTAAEHMGMAAGHCGSRTPPRTAAERLADGRMSVWRAVAERLAGGGWALREQDAAGDGG